MQKPSFNNCTLHRCCSPPGYRARVPNCLAYQSVMCEIVARMALPCARVPDCHVYQSVVCEIVPCARVPCVSDYHVCQCAVCARDTMCARVPPVPECLACHIAMRQIPHKVCRDSCSAVRQRSPEKHETEKSRILLPAKKQVKNKKNAVFISKIMTEKGHAR